MSKCNQTFHLGINFSDRRDIFFVTGHKPKEIFASLFFLNLNYMSNIKKKLQKHASKILKRGNFGDFISQLLTTEKNFPLAKVIQTTIRFQSKRNMGFNLFCDANIKVVMEWTYLFIPKNVFL